MSKVVNSEESFELMNKFGPRVCIHWKDHDEFHEHQFNRIFELYTRCLEMVVEGPWEPVYS